MTWRVAKSIKQFYAEMDARFPHRSKASDGTIGDAAHATRDSDHNPWVKDGSTGVVTACDVTEDAEGGYAEIVDLVFALLVRRKDSRIKYLIHEGRILRSYDKPGIPAWTWAPYHGTNAHIKHGHMSVKSDKAHYDSIAPWGIRGIPAPGYRYTHLNLRRGDRNVDVKHVQAKLGISADGIFGPMTEAAVKAFQKRRGLTADGIVGQITARALG